MKLVPVPSDFFYGNEITFKSVAVITGKIIGPKLFYSTPLCKCFYLRTSRKIHIECRLYEKGVSIKREWMLFIV